MGLLPKEPDRAVTSVAALRALAAAEVRIALGTFAALARRPGEAFAEQRAVLEALAAGARHALARSDVDPGATQGWSPPDLLPDDEWSQLAGSERVTPYRLWSMAVRYGERRFAFWAYVAAQTESEPVRLEAENLARAALRETAAWRQERRRAWRAEAAAGPAAEPPSGRGSTEDALSSAALVESLLVRDLTIWAASVGGELRQRLTEIAGGADPTRAPATPEGGAMQSALSRAEHLVELYLGSADRADSEANLQFALDSASRAIERLATLRRLAQAPVPVRQS